MKWIKEYAITKKSLCDELIKGFRKTRQAGFTYPGRSAKGVDPSWKDSEDASLNCLPIEIYVKSGRAYREHIMRCLQAYLEEFPVLTEAGARLGFMEPPQIQHYKPGGAFRGVHFESSGLDVAHRILAFQTFLNDIAEGGGTRFIYQDHVCRPAKGKTVIWPAGFTHSHCGEVAPKEDKYIVTGWLSFVGG